VRQPIYKTSKAKWMYYKPHLQPLLQGTNAKIRPDPINSLVFLPEPGMLHQGVALFKAEELDQAEYCLKKLLHHVPEHAAANFLVGLIYVRKGYLSDGIELMERALKTCPWNTNWQSDLAQAFTLNGQQDRADEIRTRLEARKLRKARPEDGGEQPQAPVVMDEEAVDALLGLYNVTPQ
jgi:tetratricopeptide (TPR) repeat protein